VKRVVAVAVLAVALVGCSKNSGPAAPIAQVDKAKAVQQQSDQHSKQLEQQIDGMQP
jgi:PBP1b-binding outer membrane lipoprotein LpoB